MKRRTRSGLRIAWRVGLLYWRTGAGDLRSFRTGTCLRGSEPRIRRFSPPAGSGHDTGAAHQLTGARVTRNADRAERMDLVIRRDRIAPSAHSFSRGRSDRSIRLPVAARLDQRARSSGIQSFSAARPRSVRQLPPNGRATSIIRNAHLLKEHLAVPKLVRLDCGADSRTCSRVSPPSRTIILTNRESFDRGFPVRVIRKFGWAHSLHFSPDLAERFRSTPPTWPFIIHAAEGKDASAFSEVERLDAMGVLDRRTVLVHAIALKPSDIEILQARNCSIVWCPVFQPFHLWTDLDPAGARVESTNCAWHGFGTNGRRRYGR